MSMEAAGKIVAQHYRMYNCSNDTPMLVVGFHLAGRCCGREKGEWRWQLAHTVSTRTATALSVGLCHAEGGRGEALGSHLMCVRSAVDLSMGGFVAVRGASMSPHAHHQLPTAVSRQCFRLHHHGKVLLECCCCSAAAVSGGAQLPVHHV